MRKSLTKAALIIALLSGAANAASGYYQIHLDGEVGPAMALKVKQNLALAIKEKAKRVLLLIDSPGGRVDSMHQITFMMDNSVIPVDTLTTGLAASAASTILMHGKRRYITPGAVVLTHYGSISGANMPGIGSQELANIQDYFKASGESNDIEAAMLTGNSLEFVRTHMYIAGKDITHSSLQALKYNIVDEITLTIPRVDHTPSMGSALRES